MIRVVVDGRPPEHVALDAVNELERAIAEDPDAKLVPARGRIAMKAGNVVASAAEHLSALRPRFGIRTGTSDVMTILMTVDAGKLVPEFFVARRRVIYVFDAWPASHDRLLKFVDTWRIDYAFVSSSQATERLARRATRCRFVWVPEGVDASQYHHANKTVDVLQLGRKYDALHTRIVDPLTNAGRSYLYQRTPDSLIFPTRAAFLDGLARSKISICVPSSITHPERSGDIETMTTRYLQSMASRCLVAGHAPRELVDLFGYNPVIEIDRNDPAGHLIDLVDHIDRYGDLIERNFATVWARHQWRHRWAQIRAELDASSSRS
jgi:hypothetical protein